MGAGNFFPSRPGMMVSDSWRWDRGWWVDAIEDDVAGPAASHSRVRSSGLGTAFLRGIIGGEAACSPIELRVDAMRVNRSV